MGGGGVGYYSGYSPSYSGYSNWGYGYRPYGYASYYGGYRGFYPQSYYGSYYYPGNYGYNNNYYYSNGTYASTPSAFSYQSFYPSEGTFGATTNAEQANVALIQSNDAAHIFVRVPPDAEVWFGNIKTNTLGVERSFVSPPLESGYEYTYRIRARWDENGRTIDRTRTLSVQPGRMYQLDFLNSADTDQSAQTPASTTQPASQPADNRATNPTNTTNPRDDTSNPRPVPPQQP